MQRNIAIIHGLNALFWGVAVALVACSLVVPFLTIDRQYNITFAFSFDSIMGIWDGAVVSALWNSVLLSCIASVFAIACGSAVTTLIKKFPYVLLVVMLAVYSVNPVARALSYFDLFLPYLPHTPFASNILLPALILGIHYLPIYLMRSLFVVGQGGHADVQYKGILKLVFVDIPPWVRGFPISFALFFLLTFFDYWVIQVISGNTVLYWTPLFVQKALASRALGEAALMIDIGLIVTLGAYLAAVLLQFMVRLIWRNLRPLHFRRGFRVGARNDTNIIWNFLRYIWFATVAVFLTWPAVSVAIRLVRLLSSGHSIVFTQGVGRAIVVMIILALAVAAVSAVVGLILSAVYQTNRRKYRWWLPALTLLALVPEAAYVLLSLFITGSGIIRGNPYWLFFLLASFSIPMSFFLWESVWGEQELLKLRLLGTAMKSRAEHSTGLALKEWQSWAGIIFLVMFWLTVDNVFITDFAAGPKWKPLSSVIFNATKRGFSEAEFFSTVLSAAIILTFFIVVLLVAKLRIKRGRGNGVS